MKRKHPAKVLKFPRVPTPPPTKVRGDKRKKEPKHKIDYAKSLGLF